MTVQLTREHSNGEDCGYCCPHCLISAEYSEAGDSSDEACEVHCEHCNERFAIWNETEIVQLSGFIEG